MMKKRIQNKIIDLRFLRGGISKTLNPPYPTLIPTIPHISASIYLNNLEEYDNYGAVYGLENSKKVIFVDGGIKALDSLSGRL